MKENIAGLTKRNTELESSILVNKNVNDKLVEKIVLLERRCTETQQYSRRECVEVSGLAPGADIVALEKKVIEIFESINCTIDPVNIELCYYLKSKNQPNKVIVKLSRRKDVAKVLRNKKFLKDKDLSGIGISNDVYINESLCGEYKFLWGKCKQLYTEKRINSFWFFNGNLNVKVGEDSKSIRIGHIEDLKHLFSQTQITA